MTEKTYLKIEDVQNIFGICRSTLKTLRDKGIVTTIHLVGVRGVRFDPDVIARELGVKPKDEDLTA